MTKCININQMSIDLLKKESLKREDPVNKSSVKNKDQSKLQLPEKSNVEEKLPSLINPKEQAVRVETLENEDSPLLKQARVRKAGRFEESVYDGQNDIPKISDIQQMVKLDTNESEKVSPPDLYLDDQNLLIPPKVQTIQQNSYDPESKLALPLVEKQDSISPKNKLSGNFTSKVNQNEPINQEAFVPS